jgi:hypothetical protein
LQIDQIKEDESLWAGLRRIVAWCSAGLLLSFALTMSVALGVVAPLSYSVFTAFGGAFLLGAIAPPRRV